MGAFFYPNKLIQNEMLLNSGRVYDLLPLLSFSFYLLSEMK